MSSYHPDVNGKFHSKMCTYCTVVSKGKLIAFFKFFIQKNFYKCSWLPLQHACTFITISWIFPSSHGHLKGMTNSFSHGVSIIIPWRSCFFLCFSTVFIIKPFDSTASTIYLASLPTDQLFLIFFPTKVQQQKRHPSWISKVGILETQTYRMGTSNWRKMVHKYPALRDVKFYI